MSQFLANHTAVQCDRLLARYCCHSSICLSVCLSVTMCFVRVTGGVENFTVVFLGGEFSAKYSIIRPTSLLRQITGSPRQLGRP